MVENESKNKEEWAERDNDSVQDSAGLPNGPAERAELHPLLDY